MRRDCQVETHDVVDVIPFVVALDSALVRAGLSEFDAITAGLVLDTLRVRALDEPRECP